MWSRAEETGAGHVLYLSNEQIPSVIQRTPGFAGCGIMSTTLQDRRYYPSKVLSPVTAARREHGRWIVSRETKKSCRSG